MKHYLKQFAKSIWFDVLGVALVVGIAIYSGYLGTRLDKFVDWGWITPYVPLGFISVVNVGLSMMSTRLTGRINNWGTLSGLSTYSYPAVLTLFWGIRPHQSHML